MTFDIRSLLVAVALASAFCAAARLLLWRIHPDIPGLGHWALAGGANVLTLVLVLSYGIVHWQPALALAQLATVAGLMLAWDGFRRFIGKPPLTLWVSTMMAIPVLLWTAEGLQLSTEIQALGNAVLIIILSSLIARELLTAATPDLPAMRVTGWIFVANAAAFLIRVAAANQHPQQFDPLDPNGVAVATLLWLLCLIIAVTLGMALMAAERLQADLDRKANHDPLTGALNRRAFALLREKIISTSRRNDKPMSVLLMDLDNFKQINDRLGHDVGDAMLCRFVSLAEQILRGEDVFCRFGGEEFVALLPDTPAEQALVAAERLRCAFAIETAKSEKPDEPWPFIITVSIGIAELQQHEDFTTLLRRADEALYRAKASGRNCCKLAYSIQPNPQTTDSLIQES